MGTNDPLNGIGHEQTLANLGWMIDTWQAAGRRSDHFLLTTLAPRTDFAGISLLSMMGSAPSQPPRGWC